MVVKPVLPDAAPRPPIDEEPVDPLGVGPRGIGAEISRQLKAAGRTVVASYAGNEAAAQAFTAATGIRAVRFDAGDFAASQQAMAKIAEEVGPITILVNNAGITRDATLGKMTRDGRLAPAQPAPMAFATQSHALDQGIAVARLRHAMVSAPDRSGRRWRMIWRMAES